VLQIILINRFIRAKGRAVSKIKKAFSKPFSFIPSVQTNPSVKQYKPIYNVLSEKF